MRIGRVHTIYEVQQGKGVIRVKTKFVAYTQHMDNNRTLQFVK